MKMIRTIVMLPLMCSFWYYNSVDAQESLTMRKLPVSPVIFYDGEGNIGNIFPRIDNKHGIEDFVVENTELVSSLLLLNHNGDASQSQQRIVFFHKNCGDYVRLLFFAALYHQMNNDEERELLCLEAANQIADTAASSNSLTGALVSYTCANIIVGFLSGPSFESPTVVLNPAVCARLAPTFLNQEHSCAQMWSRCLKGESQIDDSKISSALRVSNDRLFSVDFVAMTRGFSELCRDIANGFVSHSEDEWNAFQSKADKLNQQLNQPYINPKRIRLNFHRHLATLRCLRGFCEAMQFYVENKNLPETVILEPVDGTPVVYQRFSAKKATFSWKDRQLSFELP